MTLGLSQAFRDSLEAEAAEAISRGARDQVVWVGQYISPYHYAACPRCGKLLLPAACADCPGHPWTTRSDIDRWQARYAVIEAAGITARKAQDAERLAAIIGPPTRYEHEVRLAAARIKAKLPAPRPVSDLRPGEAEGL